MNDTISGIIRAVLAALGGILVTKGYLDDATLQTLIGALLPLIAVVWSIIAKQNATTATNNVVALAAKTGNPDPKQAQPTK